MGKAKRNESSKWDDERACSGILTSLRLHVSTVFHFRRCRRRRRRVFSHILSVCVCVVFVMVYIHQLLHSHTADARITACACVMWSIGAYSLSNTIHIGVVRAIHLWTLSMFVWIVERFVRASEQIYIYKYLAKSAEGTQKTEEEE